MYGIGRGSRRVFKYEESKPHGIIAGIVNLVIVYSIYLGLLSLINTFMGEELVQKDFFCRQNGIILLIVTLVIVMFYGIFLSDRVGFITWGEKVTGRKFIGTRKVWVNPYSKSRGLLFFLLLMNILIIANYFGGVPTVYTSINYIREVITLIFHIVLLVNIGQGQIHYMMALIVLYLISLVSALIILPDNLKYVAAGVFGVLILLHFIVYLIYKNKEE
ncbi:hypothetical protein [Oceanirhabdus sp. W0125-5]|uniref:hypothetical protein n=1 Tax=Oceanirhabdus sp. W0125-5 TaxID=2999116 RepID=UPI0022F339AF|nr:hypothetical protein [Oceanirhabdus sp. W0125-5]WBW96904.1 hypothetical protein OW730_24920 [Oceanirhabdus sp. W0125-5]